MMKNYQTLLLFLFSSIIAFMPLGCTSSGEDTTESTETGKDSAVPDSTVALELFAEGFTNPLSMKQGPDGRFYIVDQIGLILITDQDGNLESEPFLDIRDRMVELKNKHDERGLLGMALHPDFSDNGRFFVHYSAPLRRQAPAGWSHTKHLAEFTRNAENPLRADPSSERILLRIDEPQSNHNGGSLEFGPDNYLYLGLGDGGGANDTGTGHEADWYEANEGGNGQNTTDNLLGGIIRIDVDGTSPYGIPSDNPNASGNNQREMFAYGLRNPYRFTFDMGGSNDLFVADVGQKLWEEINIVESGGNYGWNVREGFSCFNAAKADQPLTSCPEESADGSPLLDPIIVFPHEKQEGYQAYGIAVIGGYVYRGNKLNGLDGHYFFGTWTLHHGTPAGAIYKASNDNDQWNVQPVRIENSSQGQLNRYLNAFAQDNEGELFLLTSTSESPTGTTGKIYRVVPDSDYDYQGSTQHADTGEDDGHDHEHSH